MMEIHSAKDDIFVLGWDDARHPRDQSGEFEAEDEHFDQQNADRASDADINQLLQKDRSDDQATKQRTRQKQDDIGQLRQKDKLQDQRLRDKNQQKNRDDAYDRRNKDQDAAYDQHQRQDKQHRQDQALRDHDRQQDADRAYDQRGKDEDAHYDMQQQLQKWHEQDENLRDKDAREDAAARQHHQDWQKKHPGYGVLPEHPTDNPNSKGQHLWQKIKHPFMGDPDDPSNPNGRNYDPWAKQKDPTSPSFDPQMMKSLDPDWAAQHPEYFQTKTR